MKIKTALMICTAIISPQLANAAPALAFFSGAFGGGLAFTGTVGALSLAAYSAGAWLAASGLGGLLLSAGLNALTAKKSSAPTIEAARVQTKFVDSSRWQLAGPVAVSGEVGIFGEHDNGGNFWFITAHGDAELTAPPVYILDGIEVEVSDGTDGFLAGEVLTDDFCLTPFGTLYAGTGTRVPTFRVWTVSPTAGSDYGALPAEFLAAFGSIMPPNFLLAGVCYTITRCRFPGLSYYSNAYRWRGGFGLGEPSVSIYGNFNRMYDPRNVDHDIDDPATWTASDGNPAIIWAWWRTAPYGRGRPMSEINWDLVAVAANHCDRVVLDRSGNPIPCYRGGFAFPDNKPRHECEAEILMTFDGFAAYDDQGRAYPVAGVYVAPTLHFYGTRDILSAATEVVDDGESAIDGVIVNYISPDHGYTKQPCAPWVNSAYYNGEAEPNYQTIDILGCQNHNQAVRLAKAIGLRSAASHKAGLQTGLKGLLASGVRTIGLHYDATFDGDFEIVSSVDEDPSGMAFSFAVVPMQSDRYDLGVGEEGEPPQPAPILDIDKTLGAITGLIVSAVTIETSSGAAVRLEATFDLPSRPDRLYRFRYALTGSTIYQYFSVDMDEGFAYSAIVSDGQSYDVQWQVVSAGGRATDWSAVITVVATADTVAPPALTAFSAADGVGESVISFTTANSLHQAKVRFYRGTTTVFADSSPIGPAVVAVANITSTVTNTGLAAGTYYFWGIPANGSNVPGPTSGPDTAVIT